MRTLQATSRWVRLTPPESLIHVDWMIGSPHIEVDGVAASGELEPLMRSGEWV
jgi:aminopeptidase